MNKKEIKEELEDCLSEMDAMLDNESIISFPEAFEKLNNRLNELVSKIENSIEADKSNEEETN